MQVLIAILFLFASLLAAEEQKPMCILVRSYNNEKYVERHLNSILHQEYDNYRIIYIDDASTDNTYESVRAIVKDDPRVTIVHHPTNQGSAANGYIGMHMCRPEEIIVHVDGDDWLPNNQVLSYINTIYADPDVWLTYGQFRCHPHGRRGYCAPLRKYVLKNRGIRGHAFRLSHLRTNYAGLVHPVALKDLLYKGEYYPACSDLTEQFPMFELAQKDHYRFLSKILYIHNRANPISDSRKSRAWRKGLARHIRKRPRYSPLQYHPAQPPIPEPRVDLVITSSDRPMQLYATIESLKRNASNVGQIYIVYQCSNADFERGYKIVQDFAPEATWLKQSSDAIATALTSSNAPYIAYCTDQCIITAPFDFTDCCHWLQRTRGYGFYLHLGKNITDEPNDKLLTVSDHIRAWQFCHGTDNWAHPSRTHFSIFRKKDAEQMLNPRHSVPLAQVGVCFDQSKALNISIPHMSAQALLNEFLNGKILDLSTINRQFHTISQVDYTPKFSDRRKKNEKHLRK